MLYKCQECGAEFDTQAACERHEKTHSGWMKYSLDWYAYSFFEEPAAGSSDYFQKPAVDKVEINGSEVPAWSIVGRKEHEIELKKALLDAAQGHAEDEFEEAKKAFDEDMKVINDRRKWIEKEDWL